MCATSSVVTGEGQEALEDALNRRRPSQLLLPEPGEARDRLRQRDAWVHERLERVDELERPHANGSELADPVARSGQARGLEVEDDELRLLEQRIHAAVDQRDGGAGAGDPAVAFGDLFEERTGQAVGDRRGGEERSRRVHRRHGTALLEQVDQAIECVEGELHTFK